MNTTTAPVRAARTALMSGAKQTVSSEILPTVFVVDDDISVRESLEALIASSGYRPETFATAQAFLAHARPRSPGCLVLDVGLPDLNGLELQHRLADPETLPIIFITGHGDIPTTVRAMKAGAMEFLTKPYGPDILLNAIADAIRRSCRAIEEDAQLRLLRQRYESLTPREQQVMALVVRGLLNKQVGGDLGISEITVKAHRGRMMNKIGARSLAELVNMASRLGQPTAGCN